MDKTKTKINNSLCIILNMQAKYGEEFVKVFKFNLIEIAKTKGYFYDKKEAEFVRCKS